MPLLQNQSVGVPIEFSQGDTVTLALLATNDQGIPVNLTGATFSTQIQGYNVNGPVTFGDSQHTLGNQTSNPGTFTLALASSDTANCGLGPNKEILTTVVINEASTCFRGESILAVYPGIPIQ
jgi:hypothetical protein